MKRVTVLAILMSVIGSACSSGYSQDELDAAVNAAAVKAVEVAATTSTSVTPTTTTTVAPTTTVVLDPTPEGLPPTTGFYVKGKA